MTTGPAQRRLLEALSRLHARPSGIEGLLLGLPIAIQLAEDCDLPELAAVYAALGDLAGAVQADHGGVP
jgi:hypothetical protein